MRIFTRIWQEFMNLKKIINKLSKDCTVIIIAHKSSTIENADRVFEIVNKRINVKSN